MKDLALLAATLVTFSAKFRGYRMALIGFFADQYMKVSRVSHQRKQFLLIETEAHVGQNRPTSAMRVMQKLRVHVLEG